MRQDFAPIQGVSDLFGTKKSLIRFSYSFQTNHHPITITIKCLSSVTTTTTTTTTVDISTTATLCQCQLSALVLVDLLVQVIADNRLEMLRQRPHDMNRTGGWLPISIELSFSPAPSAVPSPPTLPLATSPPPLEPTMAPNQVGRLPAILAIFAMARSLLSPWWTR